MTRSNTVTITVTIAVNPPAPSFTPAPPIGTRSGILIPLYVYPGTAWNAIIDAKKANPAVQITVVVNPSNGPGTAANPDYVTWIANLRNAGIKVLGYVYSSYSSRPQVDVTDDIWRYTQWYNIDGIFVDEVKPFGAETYYRALVAYIRSANYPIAIGNPGTSPSESYVGIFDTMVVYENLGLPSISSLSTGWYARYDKMNFAYIANGVSAFDPTFVRNSSNYVGLLYVNDLGGTNPYQNIPAYLVATAQALI